MSPHDLDGLNLLRVAATRFALPGATQAGLAGLGRRFDPVAVLAAHLIVWHGRDPDDFVRGVTSVAGDRDTGADLAAWCIEAAYAYSNLMALLDQPHAQLEQLIAPPDPRRALRRPEWRRVSWAIDPTGFPLVPLAEDLAQHLPHGLAVYPIEPARYAAGWARPGEIRIDITQPATTLAETWAHELGHQLDPRLAEVGHAGSERFAETLGPLLLEHQPETVKAAAPLIEQADQARPAIGHVARGWQATWQDFADAFEGDLTGAPSPN